jgi:hypothetical protein
LAKTGNDWKPQLISGGKEGTGVTNFTTSCENQVRLRAIDIEALALSTLGEANTKFSDEGKRGTSVMQASAGWLASESQRPRGALWRLLHNPG